MLNFTDLASVASHPLAPFTDRPRLAVAAYLARFKGSSRVHTESDLRCYLFEATSSDIADLGLLPGVELAPRRADLLAVTADDPGGVIQGLAG